MLTAQSKSNIPNTKDRVWPHFQTPRRELKLRRVAEYFNESWGVWKFDQSWSWVFDISSQWKLTGKRWNKIVKIYANRPFKLGQSVAPFQNHVMILLRILTFKFSNCPVYISENFLKRTVLYRISRGLKWENKPLKLKRSIEIEFQTSSRSWHPLFKMTELFMCENEEYCT